MHYSVARMYLELSDVLRNIWQATTLLGIRNGLSHCNVLHVIENKYYCEISRFGEKRNWMVRHVQDVPCFFRAVQIVTFPTATASTENKTRFTSDTESSSLSEESVMYLAGAPEYVSVSDLAGLEAEL